MSESDHDQRREKNDQGSQRDLQEGQLFGFNAEAENRRAEIVDRIHTEILSSEGRLASLSICKMNPLCRGDAFTF